MLHKLSSLSGNPIKNRIIKSKFNNKDANGDSLVQLELEKNFSNSNDNIYINAQIDFSNDTNPTNNVYYLPGDLLLENSTYFLINDSKSSLDYVQIKNYIPNANLISYDVNKPLWNISDKYSLRQNLPMKMFKVTDFPSYLDIDNTNKLFNTDIQEFKSEDIFNYARFRTQNINFKFNLKVIIEIKSGNLNIRDTIREFQSDKRCIIIDNEIKVIGNTSYFYLATIKNGDFIKNSQYTLYLNNKPIVIQILNILISTVDLSQTPNINEQFEILNIDRDNEGCFIKLKKAKNFLKMLFFKN